MAGRLHQIRGQMRCPECKSLNEDSAGACSTCGLILLKPAPAQPVQKRRSEDFAGQKRRAADKESEVPCQFCGGKIAANAIRCRHCSEIVNEEYYRQRAH